MWVTNEEVNINTIKSLCYFSEALLLNVNVIWILLKGVNHVMICYSSYKGKLLVTGLCVLTYYVLLLIKEFTHVHLKVLEYDFGKYLHHFCRLSGFFSHGITALRTLGPTHFTLCLACFAYLSNYCCKTCFFSNYLDIYLILKWWVLYKNFFY